MAEDQSQIYQARVPIYPRSVKGRFRTAKWSILTLAYGVYFLLPWIRWDRPTGPDQAVLFDIHDRLFYLFGLIVHPQDIFWLAGFLIIAAYLLFFVTGIAGRAFCGYFCFQTLWTDLYIFIEHLVQGERPARIRLDKAPWNGTKIFKKGLTHFLWLLVAFATGLTFTLYWANAPELALQFFTAEAPFPAYATTFFLTATTYLMAGMAREQVCTYMCPYARFQSVMFDRDTLIVAYDEKRGEGETGRAKLSKDMKTQEQRKEKGAGDCVDCGFCVQVCPTGIDIRNGLQMQCISCALCVDACDAIMDNLGWERGLIRYDSENGLEGNRSRLLRPKTIGYGAILLAVIGLLVSSIATQSQMSVAVNQVRNPLHVLLSDGRIQNSYEIIVNNKSELPMPIKIAVDGLSGAELDLGKLKSLQIEPLGLLKVFVKVRLKPTANTPASTPFRFVISTRYGKTTLKEEKDAKFITRRVN